MDDIQPFRAEQMYADENGWSDWIHPMRGYLMQCCGCDLVHEMEFAIEERDRDIDPALLNDGEGQYIIIFRAKRK